MKIGWPAGEMTRDFGHEVGLNTGLYGGKGRGAAVSDERTCKPWIAMR